MSNTVYTLGYLQRGSREKLYKLVADGVMVLDVRYSPRSAFPQWTRHQLKMWLGSRYQHVRELGNVNYRSVDLPIQLFDASVGQAVVLSWFEKGYDVCLLCACAEVSACHRLVVAGLVEAACSCTVVHL